jgi:Mor family transcriptional regulator
MYTSLTLTLPAEVYDLLAQAHPRGAEAAAMQALKQYLTAPKPKARDNAARDAEIADKFVAGTRQVQLAKDYDLSYIRIQQIVAKGKQAAYVRQHEKQTETLRAILNFEHP